MLTNTEQGKAIVIPIIARHCELLMANHYSYTMKLRSVKVLQYADVVDMGGIPVRQPLPSQIITHVDPFLLLHHHVSNIEPESSAKYSGVDPHPHRGFSPVTFIFKGDIHHRDSRGNSQIVKAGGVQWMDAGMGIIHSERPSSELAQKGGVQEIVQLWINTPANHKMDQPHYQALQRDDIPKIQLENNAGEISVIAGNYNSILGPAEAKLNLLLLRCDFNVGANEIISIPENMNVVMYVLSGSVSIAKYGDVPALHLVEFKNDGDAISISTNQETTFLVLAGEPLNEKVEKYGPFVMSSQTEVMQAIRDYQMGKMGILIEEF